MKKTSQVSGEFALIETIRRASAARPKGKVRLGIGDDCAILQPPAGHEVLVTTDFCLEGRHFRRDWHTPESAGHRCLARGVSDLAAMGGKPLAAFLSLALPASTDREWVDGFFRGLRALAEEVAVPLAGGDTAQSHSEHILADIVLVGSAPAGKALRRSTAHAGDLLYVTGRIGGSAAELISLQLGLKQESNKEHPQLFPQPRLAVGESLRRRNLATACIDISDGLSTDLQHLCKESGLSAEISLPALPVHPLAAGKVQLALHGGEDYELLFSARPSVKMPRSICGVPVTQIGRFVRLRSPQMTQLDERGRQTELVTGGWEHAIG